MTQNTPKDPKNMPVIEAERKVNSHTAREVSGQLFVCDVSLYRILFNQLLQSSNRNFDLARKYTRLAVINDGIASVQENISALKDEKGMHFVGDNLIRARMQQTPTKHIYYQTNDPRTGRDVITNEEYLPLGASVTTAITGWRRGADRAIMELVEEKALSIGPNSKGEVDYTFRWSSPRAEDWESRWIRKYNGEYGYEYLGHLTEENGIRKLEVYSYKVDATTAAHQRFAEGLGGETFRAPFEASADNGADDVVQRPGLDVHLRTLTIKEGSVSHSEVIQSFYKAKHEAEGSDRMFGILEDTMHFVQSPAIRRRIEIEVAGPVADWLVGEMLAGASDAQIQERIRDRYICQVKVLVRKLKEEQRKPQSDFESWLDKTESGLLPQGADITMAYMADLRRRAETSGAFCGEWKLNMKSLSEVLSDLQNYTGISGVRFGAGGFSKTCVKCGIRAPEEGGCGWCSSCEHSA